MARATLASTRSSSLVTSSWVTTRPPAPGAAGAPSRPAVTEHGRAGVSACAVAAAARRALPSANQHFLQCRRPARARPALPDPEAFQPPRGPSPGMTSSGRPTATTKSEPSALSEPFSAATLSSRNSALAGGGGGGGGGRCWARDGVGSCCFGGPRIDAARGRRSGPGPGSGAARASNPNARPPARSPTGRAPSWRCPTRWQRRSGGRTHSRGRPR
jgi:hypothetical protein